MFNSIQGRITEKLADSVYILSGGVEWDITVPVIDINSLPAAGEQGRVFTWLFHREDLMKLYGFADAGRRDVFLELLKVEGIGPKGAIKIMGGISHGELLKALETEDLSRLERVPGLGKKTAQKMLLALRGKLAPAEAADGPVTPYGELVNALAEMGYDKRRAAAVLAQVDKALPPGLGEDEKEARLFKDAIVILSGA
jgi:Holliday junction DNA helicase RuvA